LEEEKLARAGSQRRKFTGDGVPPMRGNRRHSFSDSEITGVTPSVVPRNMPPQPPPQGEQYTVISDSGSEAYHSPSGRRHHDGRNAALAGGAAAAAMSHGSPSRLDASQRRSSRDDSIVSPPVSVKVKMHNDGRHVTLRRLNEEEAAAEREARKRERQNRNRNGSLSSLDGQSKDRWRRTEAMEAAQAQEMASNPPPQHFNAPIPMPEPFIHRLLQGHRRTSRAAGTITTCPSPLLHPCQVLRLCHLQARAFSAALRAPKCMARRRT
jgi:hypothetical protein